VALAAFREYEALDGYLTAGAEDVGFLAEDDDICAAVPVAAARDSRRAALAAHGTQVELIPGGFALSNRIAQPLLDVEYYRLLAGDPPPRQPDESPSADIFSGLE
jgi:N-acetyl-1-D-myo-inositol-2-amino-2-deoxy-alpha-D-glucopyranoside deacetylase